VRAVACGQAHTLAITDSGDLWVWGCGMHGVLGLNSDKDLFVPCLMSASHFGGAKVEQVECGSEHSVAVTSSGQCWTWGCNQGGQLGLGDERNRRVPTLLVPESLDHTEILMVSCGEAHTLVVTGRG